MIQRVLAPSARAASTNSSERTSIVRARTTRAVPVHPTAPSTMSSVSAVERPSATPIAVTERRKGSASSASTTRINAASIARSLVPASIPERTPASAPIDVATSVAASATVSESRAPSASLATRSRKSGSTPSQCEDEGPGSAPVSVRRSERSLVKGSCGTTSGPAIAKTASATTIARPKGAPLVARKRRTKRDEGDVTASPR